MPNKILFITALNLEFLAVQSFLENCKEDITNPNGTVYETGTYLNWEIGLAEIGQGNINAASETTNAIAHFNPEYVFLVGVAGGIKDVNLGDVVIAEWVKSYERGKETDTGYLLRNEVMQSDHILVQRAKANIRNSKWLNKLEQKIKPKALVGGIASGEKVVASNTKDAKTYQLLKKHCSDALAVEMEGIGFLRAIHPNNAKGIVIRGISDLLSKKEESDESGWQEKAAHHAATFAFAMLENLISTTESKAPLSSPDIINAPILPKKIKAFANYEKERQALDKFITTEKCNKRIFLIRGNSGYGKSSLIKPYLELDNFPSNIDLVHIQLGKGEHIYSVPDFILLVARSIGGAEKLPSFYEQLNNNNERGKEYLTNLINSWFQDISILNRQVVLIIDAYEKSRDNIRNWINESLLEYTATSSIIRVVIAGQEVPNPTIAWGNFSKYCPLEGVKDPEHWLPIFVEMKRKIPLDDVSPIDHLRQICDIFVGRPFEIMKYIEGLPNEK